MQRFFIHFLEMCAAMCAGGIALNAGVFSAAAALGRPNLATEAPEIAVLIIAFNAALAMAVYMALRGHPVRHNVEMSGITLLGAVPIIAALWIGLFPRFALDSWFVMFKIMCAPLCVVMLIVMLARFDHYSGRGNVAVGGSHAHATR